MATTITITINGRSVTTELHPIPVGAHTGEDFLARHGSGQRTYRVSMILRPARDRQPDAVDSTGAGWLYDWNVIVRNRRARIIAVATPETGETHRYGAFNNR